MTDHTTPLPLIPTFKDSFTFFKQYSRKIIWCFHDRYMGCKLTVESVVMNMIKDSHMMLESTSSSTVGTFAFLQCLYHQAKRGHQHCLAFANLSFWIQSYTTPTSDWDEWGLETPVKTSICWQQVARASWRQLLVVAKLPLALCTASLLRHLTPSLFPSTHLPAP